MPSDSLDASDIVEGGIRFSLKEIKAYVRRFKDKQIRFIQDEETIVLVKEQRTSGEYSLYEQYLRDPSHKILAQMGLTLRRLDEKKKHLELQNLRDKIRKKHGEHGLHIAQFVQANVLGQLIVGIAPKSKSLGEVQNQIVSFFNGLNQRSLFVQQNYNPSIKGDEIIMRIRANQPEIFIVFATKSAIPIIRDIKRILTSRIKKEQLHYELETIEEAGRLVLFLYRLPYEIL
ncbi:MAG: hypothetical protein ABIJ21_05085 [Nanoarchaeota archaeon]